MSDAELNALQRIFEFNGTRLADPDEDLTPDQVRQVYSGSNPALTNATIEGPEVKDGIRVYKFVAAVRTKG